MIYSKRACIRQNARLPISKSRGSDIFENRLVSNGDEPITATKMRLVLLTLYREGDFQVPYLVNGSRKLYETFMARSGLFTKSFESKEKALFKVHALISRVKIILRKN